MTLNLATVRAGIKTNIDAGSTGLDVFTVFPESLNVNSVFVGFPSEIEFHTAFGGGSGSLTRVMLTIHVIVTRVTPEGVTNLDAAVLAVRLAIESDQTLAGSVQTSVVRTAGNFGGVNYANVECLGADLSLDCWS